MKWSGVVIMFGRLYYNQPLSDSITSSHRKVVCRDLRTGDLIWERNGTSINMGTIYEYWSPNQHGTHPYLWTYDNIAIDPFTGYNLFKINNVPSGTTVSSVGPNGEWLIYVFGGALTPSTLFYRPTLNVSWVACWNFSAIPSMLLGPTGTSAWQWRPVGKTHDGKQGYSWNITLPEGLRATTFNIAVLEDRIIAGEGWQQFGFAQPTGKFRLWAVSLKKGTMGTKLWDIWIKPPVPNATLQFNGASMCSLKDGVFVVRSKETRQWIGFDINNGKQLWITEPQNQWMMYSSGCTISDGVLYSYGYGGTIYAYDVKNGKLLWTAATDPCGLEGPYDRWPVGSIYLIDGKIYATTSEHSATHPLYRGWKLYVFDAKNGAPIWNITGFWQGLAFADGYMVGLDGMDLLMYCFGKGPTATTVTASPKTCTNGAGVVIEGTVMDISPGTKSTALTARFPNGVPAVADECMTPWMEHLYKQYALPMDVKGVSVTLDAVGPDGKWIHIGDTTTDSTGYFSLVWTPPSEGLWTIVATFPGSKSYWPSYAETKVGVMAAPVPSATTEQAETLQNAIENMQTVQTIIIVLVAIAIIIGVYSIYDHRKLRK